MKSKEKVLHVLEALFLGIDVKLPTGETNYTYTYHEGKIWQVSEVFEGDTEIIPGRGKEYLFDFEIPINSFIAICDRLSEEDIVGLTFTKAMRKEAIKRIERRENKV